MEFQIPLLGIFVICTFHIGEPYQMVTCVKPLSQLVEESVIGIQVALCNIFFDETFQPFLQKNWSVTFGMWENRFT